MQLQELAERMSLDLWIVECACVLRAAPMTRKRRREGGPRPPCLTAAG